MPVRKKGPNANPACAARPPREGLHIPGLHILLGDAAIDQLRSHSASWYIIPIEESGRPSIREANLEAPALRDGIVFDREAGRWLHLAGVRREAVALRFALDNGFFPR